MGNDSCPFGMNYRERITKAFLLRNKDFLFASQRVETNGPEPQRRDTKREIRKRRRQVGIAALIRGQDVFKDVFKARPHVPQAVEDDQKTDHPDDHAKKFGRFHIAVPAKAESTAAVLSSQR